MISMEESSYKVPGGKLVKVKLSIAAKNSIESVQILGDFFLHPEEAILVIERTLAGVELDEAAIARAIENVLQEYEATIIGASSTDFAKAILQAAKLA